MIDVSNFDYPDWLPIGTKCVNCGSGTPMWDDDHNRYVCDECGQFSYNGDYDSNDDIPFCCQTCGGDYPNCADSCKVLED